MQRMHAAMAMQRVEIDNAVKRITRGLVWTGWDGHSRDGQGMGMAGQNFFTGSARRMGYKKIGASVRHGGV